MPPGADQAIESAARDGWVAVLLVIIVLCMVAAIIWVWKANTTRIGKLETVIQERLFSIAEKSTEAITLNTAAMAQTSEDSRLTREVLVELRQAVQQQHSETSRLLTNLEAAPCIARVMGLFSSETMQRLELISKIKPDQLKDVLDKIPKSGKST